MYSLADRVSLKEAQDIGFSDIKDSIRKIKAVKTGEFRCPKKGEWYLSGTIVQAYKAPDALSSPYHIVKLVVWDLYERSIAITGAKLSASSSQRVKCLQSIFKYESKKARSVLNDIENGIAVDVPDDSLNPKT